MGKNMSPEQAQALARKYQERYPDASPREIMNLVNDPTSHFYDPILEGMYRSFEIPSNLPNDRADAWKRAVDQRLHSQPLRQRRREELESVGAVDAFRRRVADVVKPASMAASVTPYDLGLGDVGYAAGELIDPEGTYGDAALAAAGGVLTGGIGSGALMTKAAKEARKGIKRADDVEDLIPTKIGPPPGSPPGPSVPVLRKATEFQDYGNRYSTGGRYPEFQKQMRSRFSTGAPYEVAFGVGGAAALGKLGRERLRDEMNREPFDRDREFTAREPWDRDREFMGRRKAMQNRGDMAALKTLLESDWDLSEAESKARARARNIGYEDIMRQRQAERTPVDPNLSVAMMNEVRMTTDYGNAFAETSERNQPSSFTGSIDQLSDIPDSYEGARNEAARIYNQTGTVPSSLARSLGKHEALLTTRSALLDEDDRMLREGIAFKPSMPIDESPPEQPMTAGQGSVEDREIEPSMGYFGE